MLYDKYCIIPLWHCHSSLSFSNIFAQIQIHLAYLFTLCKTKTSIEDIYKNTNFNVKGKYSAKTYQQSTQLIKNSSTFFLNENRLAKQNLV